MSNENKENECLDDIDNKDNKRSSFLNRSWSFMNQVENALTSSYNTGFFHGVLTGIVTTILAYRSFK